VSPRHDERRRLAELRTALEVRAAVCEATRSFFRERGYIEVLTPVRIPTPAAEEHITAIPADGAFLRTSPELHMKRLLCAGYERIFQIGPCFRRNERGRLHLPEFTMLEWYRAGTDAHHLLGETREWLQSVIAAASRVPGLPAAFPGVDPDAPWFVISVDEAFERFAGCSVQEVVDAGVFEQVLVERVEPALPTSVPAVLTGYPPEQAGYARIDPGPPPRAERWELYLRGIETANACTELTDPDEQEERFRRANRIRGERGDPVYEFDHAFLSAMRSGMPPAAGIAVGIERLLAVLLGADSIDDVTLFPDG